MSELIGPGVGCMYCGEDYGEHVGACPMLERKNRPRRYRTLCPYNKHPNGRASLYIYGCYFPMTDLCVGDMGGRGTGMPQDVEWMDEEE